MKKTFLTLLLLCPLFMFGQTIYSISNMMEFQKVGTNITLLPHGSNHFRINGDTVHFTNGKNLTGGNVVLTTDTTSFAHVVNTPKNTGNIVAATGITAEMLSPIMIYNGNSAIDILANPQIVAGKLGQIIMIIGSSDTNTLKLDTGTGIVCPTSRTLGINDIWKAVYTSNGWVEISFTNN